MGKKAKHAWRGTNIRENLAKQIESLLSSKTKEPQNINEFVNIAVREKLAKEKAKSQ